jgi:hypothetical protein
LVRRSLVTHPKQLRFSRGVVASVSRLAFFTGAIHISALNLGKTWRNQKLVANQDNKKYIAATVWRHGTLGAALDTARNRLNK